MMRRCLHLTPFVLVACLVFAAGCEPSAADDPPHPESHPTEHDDSHHETHAHHGDSHGHADSHFHLAPKMVVLSRRFSAIWFAGKNQRIDMLEYQIHELEELYTEIERAAPTENGVDVAGRLKTDVISRLDDLKQAAKQTGNEESPPFNKLYKQMTADCSQCHADTGHDYLDVTLPTRNPYPNLDLGKQSASQ